MELRPFWNWTMKLHVLREATGIWFPVHSSPPTDRPTATVIKQRESEVPQRSLIHQINQRRGISDGKFIMQWNAERNSFSTKAQITFITKFSEKFLHAIWCSKMTEAFYFPRPHFKRIKAAEDSWNDRRRQLYRKELTRHCTRSGCLRGFTCGVFTSRCFFGELHSKKSFEWRAFRIEKKLKIDVKWEFYFV